MSRSLVVLRLSPIEAWYESCATGRRAVEGMSLASALRPTVPAGTSVRLWDLSWRRRLGCKGPAAPAWLASLGLAVPVGANRFVETDGVVVARLATSEFLVEATGGRGDLVERARHQLSTATCPSGVYPIARFDFVIGLGGAAAIDLLRQTCSVDFAPVLAAASAAEGEVLYTSMIGVGVLAAAVPTLSGPTLNLWCDPSFAHYFWTTLLEVAHDLGGGVAIDGLTGPGGAK